MSDKLYINGVTIKELETKNGKFMKMSFNTKKFTDELLGYANEKGYVNCNVGKRKEVGKFGETHYLVLDTWKPDDKNEPKQEPLNKKVTGTTATDEQSDLPF